MKKPTYVLFCRVIVSAFLLVVTVERVSAQSKKLTTKDLTDRAEVVAVGKVTGIRSEWNQDRTRIYTKVTISVDQYVKGEQSEKILTVTHLGGEVGEVGELYTGTPKFQTDEEVLIFIEKDRKNNLRITGGAQGKLRIIEDEKTGKKILRGVPLRLEDEEKLDKRSTMRTAERPKIFLEDFIREVKGYIKE